jgi:hypothetical protein
MEVLQIRRADGCSWLVLSSGTGRWLVFPGARALMAPSVDPSSACSGRPPPPSWANVSAAFPGDRFSPSRSSLNTRQSFADRLFDSHRRLRMRPLVARSALSADSTGDNTNPAAGIQSNADNMARWLTVQLARGKLAYGSRLFSDSTWQQLTTLVTPMPSTACHRSGKGPRPDFYGCALGLIVRDSRGRKLLTHRGSLPGFVSHRHGPGRGLRLRRYAVVWMLGLLVKPASFVGSTIRGVSGGSDHAQHCRHDRSPRVVGRPLHRSAVLACLHAEAANLGRLLLLSSVIISDTRFPHRRFSCRCTTASSTVLSRTPRVVD